MVGDIYKTSFNSEKIALNYKGNSVTYGQLDRNVLAYACYLKNAGLKVGGKVVLSCLNSRNSYILISEPLETAGSSFQSTCC